MKPKERPRLDSEAIPNFLELRSGSSTSENKTYAHLSEYACSCPLAPAWPLLLAAKIILLGDVVISTILYAVLVVGVSDRLTHTRSLCP